MLLLLLHYRALIRTARHVARYPLTRAAPGTICRPVVEKFMGPANCTLGEFIRPISPYIRHVRFEAFRMIIRRGAIPPRWAGGRGGRHSMQLAGLLITTLLPRFDSLFRGNPFFRLWRGPAK